MTKCEGEIRARVGAAERCEWTADLAYLLARVERLETMLALATHLLAFKTVKGTEYRYWHDAMQAIKDAIAGEGKEDHGNG